MKNNSFKIGLFAVAIAIAALTFPPQTASLHASQPSTDTTPTAAALSVPALSAQEIAALQYMREEEKLAHDVYVAMYAKWQLPIFNNITQSEATHMNAIKVLLDRYGIADPAAGKAAGEFTNPELQALYARLMAQGSQSATDALKVGVAIEQVDIQDLNHKLALTTHSDILRVYNNLLRGSQNHLRAFQKLLN